MLLAALLGKDPRPILNKCCCCPARAQLSYVRGSVQSNEQPVSVCCPDSPLQPHEHLMQLMAYGRSTFHLLPVTPECGIFKHLNTPSFPLAADTRASFRVAGERALLISCWRGSSAASVAPARMRAGCALSLVPCTFSLSTTVVEYGGITYIFFIPITRLTPNESRRDVP